jgi:outer membrane protein assembly factor BamB
VSKQEKKGFLMLQRKTALFTSSQKISLLRGALLSVVILLVSCGGITPSHQHATSHPAPPPPSLFVLSSQGDVQAYRADGTSLWQASTDANSESMPTLSGTHLIEAGQTIIVATDAVRVYSRTGQLRWQHDLSSATDDSLVVGSTLYLVGGTATAWNITTGTLQWQQSNTLLFPVTSLTSDAHDLFIGGGSQVTALNLQSGIQEWSIQGDPGEIMKALFLEGDTLLIQTDGSLTAVQKTTGKIIWHRESQIQSLFIDAAAKRIYKTYIDVDTSSLSSTSGLRALNLNSGTQIWNVSFPIKIGEIGSISSAGILWAGQTAITAWDLHGKQRWQIPYVGQQITQVMSVEQASFFLLLAQDGTITTLDALTGRQRWQAALGSGNGFQIITQSTLIWIVNQDTGNIIAFDLNGKMRWSLNGPSSVNEVLVE